MTPKGDDVPTHGSARAAAILVILEAAGLAVLAAWQVMAIVEGDTTALDSAWALVVLTIAGAAIVAVFGVVTWRGPSWGRSGAIVTQLLILAVALGAMTGSYAHPLTAIAIALPALLTLALLIVAVRAAARAAAADDREPDADAARGR